MSSEQCEDRFISGDWGTTHLRLRLVSRNPFRVLEEIEVPQGVARVHEAWEGSSEERIPFFQRVLSEAMGKFQERIDGLPVFLSGMGSSTVGMLELPYDTVPKVLDEPLRHECLSPSANFPHEVRLITGLRWETRDVMRGEETQIVGLMGNEELALPDDVTILLPGTHSKHVCLEKRVLMAFQTFPTGDLFQAIAGHTILRQSLSGRPCDGDLEVFRAGVRNGAEKPLLSSLFGIRCASLFEQRTVPENDAFLSGLLLGNELSLLREVIGRVAVAEDALGQFYIEALRVLGLEEQLIIIPEAAMADAVPRAHAVMHEVT